DDVLAMVSGTFGLTGAADGALVLQRQRNQKTATVSVIGRDVEEQELALEFNPNKFSWAVTGKADEVAHSKESQKVLDTLRDAGKPLSPKEIATFLCKNQDSTRTLLFKMKTRGEVAVFDGEYQLPDYEPPDLTVPTVPNAQKTGNAPKT